MKKITLLMLPLVALLFGFMPAKKCHSEEFNLAKSKLRQMELTKSQHSAIAMYEKTFHKNWNHTHRAKGCRHHEAHAQEFIAAAAGVMTDREFKKFQGRKRSSFEQLGHSVWKNRVFIQNLKKIAADL